MILLFGLDWADGFARTTAWAPIFVSDEEINALSRMSKDIMWPHPDALYIAFNIPNVLVGEEFLETYMDRDGFAVNKKLGKKTYIFRESSGIKVFCEIRIYEDCSYTLCFRLDTQNSNRRSDNPFMEFAYNQESERWEPLTKNYSEYPHILIDQIERSLSLTVED